jgi:hypothetical protein
MNIAPGILLVWVCRNHTSYRVRAIKGETKEERRKKTEGQTQNREETGERQRRKERGRNRWKDTRREREGETQ